MYGFYKDFCEATGVADSIKFLPLRHSQDRQFDGNYIRKEMHDTEIISGDHHVPLFFDIIDNKESVEEHVDAYYHVPFGVMTYFTRSVDIQQLLKPLGEICDAPKPRFCSYCFKNLTWGRAPLRHQFYQRLNERKRVDWVTDEKRFDIDLFDYTVELLKPYRFNIAFENEICPGYINEKIFNAFLAGSIPIFDGTRDVFKYFNSDSFIFAGDFATQTELIEYILEVENSKSLMDKHLSTPPCTEEGLQKLFWWKKNLW